MKALTICQPYAELIASGEKVVENRTWPTRYRGPLLIHAGMSREWLDEDVVDWADGDLAFGAVVALAWLADCVRREDLPARLQMHRYANGPWCFVLDKVTRVSPPIPCRGLQRLWTPAEDTSAAVLRRLEATS